MSKKHLYWNNISDIALLIQSLKNDNISICTTDTVLGLLGITSKKAFEGLNEIKQRMNKPYLILIPSREAIFQFADIYPSNQNMEGVKKSVQKLVNYCWPGPVTLIFKAKKDLPEFIQSQFNTVALRFPDHPGLRAVMDQIGPLFSTSANVTGEPIPEIIGQIKPEIMQKIDFLMADRENKARSTPSTILDCTDFNAIKIVREGSYSMQELEKFFVSFL